MLVMTQKVDDSIYIVDRVTGEYVRVTVCEIDRNKVRIGFHGDRARYAIFRKSLMADAVKKGEIPNGDYE
jgi:sRNA-binding carbon storage regulator CsrA